MRCWSFPRRSLANNGGSVDVRNDYRRLSRVAALEAGATLVDSEDEANATIIIYDFDIIYDAIEVAASSRYDVGSETDATMCTDSSLGEDDDDDARMALVAIDATSNNSDESHRAEGAGAYAIDPETGASLPVAIPVESNDDVGTCHRRRFLRIMTSNSAAMRARRTFISPRGGKKISWKLAWQKR